MIIGASVLAALLLFHLWGEWDRIGFQDTEWNARWHERIMDEDESTW